MKRAVCLAWLLVGCGVGRAVVGEHGSGFGMQECERALPCEPLPLFEPENVPDPAAAIDLIGCDSRDALCSGAATMPSGQALAQCSVPAAGFEHTFANTAGFHQLGCGAWRLLHTAVSGEPPHARIEVEAWNQAHIEVESDEPATLELSGGSMDHVSLALRGPVTLRVLDSDHISDLRVLVDGAAQIELTRIRAGTVAIAAPQAEVLMRRSALDGLRVAAKRLELESSYITDAVWHAESLSAADATLSRVRSEVARSVLSACDAAQTSFMGCRSWTSVQGHFTDVKLSACAEEASVYGSAIARGQLDGDLLLDGASLDAVVLGVGAASAITTWDTQLSDITFCADRHALSLGGESAARCAHCDLAPEPVMPAACVLERSEARVEDSESCPTLERPPLCAEPQPERMRPPRM